MALYVAGLLTTHSNKNILTIIAVLGVLPASKEAVNLIMRLRFKQTNDDLHNRVEDSTSNLHIIYDLIFTSSEEAMKLDVIAVSSNTVIAYSSQKKLNESTTEKYIKNYLSNNGKANFTVKIYKDDNKFINRIKELDNLENAGGIPKAVTLLIAYAL